MNMKSVSYILGWILNVEAALMGLPLVTALLYGERAILQFNFVKFLPRTDPQFLLAIIGFFFEQVSSIHAVSPIFSIIW